MAYAHRVAWELAFGPIPDGLLVCHRCDTPQCVRPDHLFLGTPRDNTRDMIAKGRAVFHAPQSTGKRGHAMTPSNVRVSPSGSRSCRACDRVRARQRRVA